MIKYDKDKVKQGKTCQDKVKKDQEKSNNVKEGVTRSLKQKTFEC